MGKGLKVTQEKWKFPLIFSDQFQQDAFEESEYQFPRILRVINVDKEGVVFFLYPLLGKKTLRTKAFLPNCRLDDRDTLFPLEISQTNISVSFSLPQKRSPEANPCITKGLSAIMTCFSVKIVTIFMVTIIIIGRSGRFSFSYLYIKVKPLHI